MDSSVAIRIENLSKAYRIWANPADRLISSVWRTASGLFPRSSTLSARLQARAEALYQSFYALRDVSFTVRRGEGMGIIGQNGSGKSTLLQMIAGTLQPTQGVVEVKGRVAALLELGSGFNPDFTGRENVYLNAAVLGLSREQIDARFEAIAAFADIGDFINHPVLTYSSGMYVRLAFAVAVNVDPDILIIDEALSVGDARFQLKCARAIDRFIAQGVTLLFVSHDPSLVKRLCQGAVLLERGNMIYAGRPNDVVNLYSKLLADGGSLEALAPDIATLKTKAAAPAPEGGAVPQSGNASSTSVATASPSHSELLRLRALETILHAHADAPELVAKAEKLLADERLHVQVTGQEFSYGGDAGSIREVAILDAENRPRTWFTSGEPVTVKMVVEAFEDFDEPIFAMTVKNAAGVEIYGTNTFFSKQPAPAIKARKLREVTFAFAINLMPGFYFLSFGFTQFVGQELLVIHRRYDAIKIEVHPRDRSFGIAHLNAVISSRPA